MGAIPLCSAATHRKEEQEEACHIAAGGFLQAYAGLGLTLQCCGEALGAGAGAWSQLMTGLAIG